MKRISHRNHIDANIPAELKDFMHRRYEQLVEDSGGEVIPIIILVEPDDNITGPDYAFIGSKGLLSDAYEEHAPREPGFIRPYEWVSYHEDLQLYEMLLLQDPDNGYWVLVSAQVVEQNESLKWVLTAESQAGGLSKPLPLY